MGQHHRSLNQKGKRHEQKSKQQKRFKEETGKNHERKEGGEEREEK
jgi:hypothetical protein